MKSSTTPDFWASYQKLPPEIKARARTAYRLWRANPRYPSLRLSIQIRLQQPYVDPKQCIDCGVCEPECPVMGLRAIRVTAENETRMQHHRMVL